MRWIIGLGNPGKKYEATRHNVGFLVVDHFARRHGFDEFRKKFSALVASRALDAAGGEKVYLVKPQTYMNLSGTAVRETLEYFGGNPEELIVVHDDLDLPLGRLRFRARGSSGGHRGVQSVMDVLGTDHFVRLKVGIGREEGRDAADFVLSPAGPRERAVLDRAVARASESLGFWIAEGVERAAGLYNAPDQEPGNGSNSEGDK